MRAAFFGVDVVDEGVDVLLIAVIVLHGDLDNRIILDAVEVDGFRIEFLFLAVEMLNEGADAAFEVERLGLDRVDAVVCECDRDAVIQESEFTQAMAQRLVTVRRDREDFRIRYEMDARPGFFRRADHCQRFDGNAALKSNLVDLAVALDLDFHARRESVDDGNANAVQAPETL